MGLEAINFFFRAEEQIEYKVASNKEITPVEDRKYVYKEEDNYWIDLEFQDSNALSIRITLCNPTEAVLTALNHLMLFLFDSQGGILLDANTKQTYKEYNNEVQEALRASYLSRKKVFEEIYGDHTAAIGSEEFYKRLEDN